MAADEKTQVDLIVFYMPYIQLVVQSNVTIYP